MKIALPLLVCILYSVMMVMPVSAQTATSSSSSSTRSSSASSSATSTASSTTTTKGGVEMPDELPETGGGHTTLALIILGGLSIGVGLYTKYALPLVLEDES